MKKKTVLIIVYYFPPRGGVAVIRTVKYVKFLRKYGWEPIILTAKQTHFQFRDDSLLNELPEGIKIIRTKPPLIQQWVRSTQNQMRTNKSGENRKKESDKKASPLYLLLRNLKNKFNRLFFLIDDYEGWRKTALKAAGEIIRKNHIALIYTSSLIQWSLATWK